MGWSGEERLHWTAFFVRRYGDEKDFSPRCAVGIGDGTGSRLADQPSLRLDIDCIADRRCPLGKASLAQAAGERTACRRRQTVKISKRYVITRPGINVNSRGFELLDRQGG